MYFLSNLLAIVIERVSYLVFIIVLIQTPSTGKYINLLISFLFFLDWLTPFSMAVSNFLCPLIVGICRRKSTRLTAVTGGLVTALGCLFTSFATQFHQLFFSYGFMMGKK